MKKKYTVMNPSGIHARPALKIVEAAVRHSSDSYLVKDGASFFAKSLVNMISIGAKFGDVIEVVAEGEDSQAAVEAIGAVLTAEH
ncbi:HPr family phosphocarrier protein [Cohnella rhizosphaerae]|uniref:HPr family phosphocarrier protein n=1 Tax=Cohnella rhizosphaerae TaxID=1457232 RepID=A0A9X4L0X0_9BACL|nr:HPr family phosphocarrier protein [Cohnella rhizosphaerae]MDG0814517.1 HPr family phosphocarrier protein [Cohnella rhizosphaerae]